MHFFLFCYRYLRIYRVEQSICMSVDWKDNEVEKQYFFIQPYIKI